MRVVVVPFELDMQDAQGRLRGHDDRPKGMHLSDVIRDYVNRTVHKGKRKTWAAMPAADRDRMARYVELGFAWEAIFERAFEERQLRHFGLIEHARVINMPSAKDARKLARLGDPNIVYIGRPSKWGNPFAVEKFGRAGAIERFRKMVATQPKFVAAAKHELTGKTLACFCAPLPCHGDVLAAIVNDRPKLARDVVVKRDGLWGSPDAVDELLWELWEFKLTWKTARRVDRPADIASDPAFAEWLMQIKGYAHCLRMTVCNLVVFFVNGDYKEPRVPKAMHLRLTFDKGELVENWTKIQNHKRTMERGLGLAGEGKGKSV